MRKYFFSKAICSSTKKECLHTLFLEIFEKYPEKKPKTSEKLTGFVLMNIFTDTF